MPAALGPLVGFALGALLAWLAAGATSRHALRSGDPRTSGLAVVALYAALVYAPVNAYFLVVAPDWSFAYLLEAQGLPSAVLLLLVIADAAAVVLGFSLGRRRSSSIARKLALFAVPAGAALLLVVALFHRFRIDATTQQFRGDFGTRSVAGGPLGYALLWMDAILVAGLVVAARALGPARRTGDAV